MYIAFTPYSLVALWYVRRVRSNLSLLHNSGSVFMLIVMTCEPLYFVLKWCMLLNISYSRVFFKAIN